jgi:hypothetical protein
MSTPMPLGRFLEEVWLPAIEAVDLTLDVYSHAIGHMQAEAADQVGAWFSWNEQLMELDVIVRHDSSIGAYWGEVTRFPGCFAAGHFPMHSGLASALQVHHLFRRASLAKAGSSDLSGFHPDGFRGVSKALGGKLMLGSGYAKNSLHQFF